MIAAVPGARVSVATETLLAVELPDGAPGVGGLAVVVREADDVLVTVRGALRVRVGAKVVGTDGPVVQRRLPASGPVVVEPRGEAPPVADVHPGGDAVAVLHVPGRAGEPPRAVPVAGPVVLGRAPRATGAPEHEGAVLVAVDSPRQEVSATHLDVRPGTGIDLGVAVVTDLGSTNGSVVTLPGLEPEPLEPGVPLAVVPGAVVDLGDGVLIEVGRP